VDVLEDEKFLPRDAFGVVMILLGEQFEDSSPYGALEVHDFIILAGRLPLRSVYRRQY
jgi:hypothetical protein